jgi:carnitine 3-dehydrogenase
VTADAELPRRVAIVGCGVIGAGWASRFALNGVEVRVADPSPVTTEVIREVGANADAAWRALGLQRRHGSITPVASIADAVAGAELIQESVPERIETKQAVLAEIENFATGDAVIASSTSGLLPSALQERMSRPERLVVGHPFNPVYLLPLVEVVGGARTAPDTVEKVSRFYRAAGMHPLHVRVEIDAFIADRLMEAVWREALWLVRDGIATTAEIDDVITRGFGLRWAQMGLFETFRVAGGQGGLRHFLEQFGPTLGLPWSHLMDTPELTDELIDTLVRQSDEQSGAIGLRELERTRDRNLVAILAGLEANEWGAGLDIAALRARLGTDGMIP